MLQKSRHQNNFERRKARERQMRGNRRFSLRLLTAALIFGLAAPTASVFLLSGAATWLDYNAISYDKISLLIFSWSLNALSGIIQSVGQYLALLTLIISVGVFGLRKQYAWWNISAQMLFSPVVSFVALYTTIGLAHIDRADTSLLWLGSYEPIVNLLVQWSIALLFVVGTVGISKIKTISPYARSLILLGFYGTVQLLLIVISAVFEINKVRGEDGKITFLLISLHIIKPIISFAVGGIAMYFLGRLLMKKLDPASQEL